MKICMVQSTPFPPEEGIGNYTYNLSKTLIDKGHKVLILTRSSENRIQKEEINGIKVIRAPFIPLYPFYLYLHGKSANKIFREIEQDIDIVHFHTPLPSFIKTNLPTITTVHTPSLTDYQLVKIQSFFDVFSKISARFVSYPQEKKIINVSEIITTSTNSIANELKRHYLNGKKVIVTGNGVDENFYYPLKKKVSSNRKNILFVGRIAPEKGLFDLVECARHLCNKRSDVFFNIVGKGRDLGKVQRKVRKFGLQNRFIFFGQIEKNNLVKLYQNSTIFVLPSYREGIPTVLLEAMSCGLPVVATDVRGNHDLVTNGKNGILVQARNPKKLADAILKILENRKLSEKLGNAARKTIVEKYTWDNVSSKFLKCYEQLAKI